MMYVYRPVVTKTNKAGRKLRKRTRYYWLGYSKTCDGRGGCEPLTAPDGTRISTRDAAEAELARRLALRERRAVGLTNQFIEAATMPVRKLLANYLHHLRRKRRRSGRPLSRRYLQQTAHAGRWVVDRGMTQLKDLQPDRIEAALATLTHLGKSPKTVNDYRGKLHSLCEFAITVARVLERNPVKVVSAIGGGPTKVRRALTADEAARLLHAARLRPLAEYGRASVAKDDAERTKRRDTWRKAPLTRDMIDAAAERGRATLQHRPTLITKLERRGHERALWYELAVLTGLRVGEIAALTWSNLDLNTLPARIRLTAAKTKSERADVLPLKHSLAEKLRALREPSKGKPTDPVFSTTPTRRSFLKDCEAAGIIRVNPRGRQIPDDRGRTIDLHALRTTFITWLSVAETAPRTAQKLARHSTITLTMGTYTDDRLLDGASAIEKLPTLAPDEEPESIPMRATGTDESAVAAGFAVGFAVNACEPAGKQTNAEKTVASADSRNRSDCKDLHANSQPCTIGATGHQLNFLWPESAFLTPPSGFGWLGSADWRIGRFSWRGSLPAPRHPAFAGLGFRPRNRRRRGRARRSACLSD